LLLAHQPGHSVFAYAPALLAQRPRHSGAAVALGMGLKDLLDLVVCVKFCKSDQGAWKGFFTQGVILTTATGAGETALLRRSALAGPVVNNASALFKSLEITPHFFLMRCVTA